MKPDASKSWRADGDSEAFEHSAWELKAEQFCHSARRLMDLVAEAERKPSFDLFSLPFTAEFVISLAIELISKAYYLRAKLGPKERIYTHSLGDLGIDPHLSPKQVDLMRHSERYVVWAGRYPTPKWTKESFKEEYDVPSVIEGRVEKINGENIPNTASLPRIGSKLDLYHLIHELWKDAGG